MSKRKLKEVEEHGHGDLKVVKLSKGLENKEVVCAPRRLPKTPAHLPKAHTLAGFFGVVRSGKTNAAVNLIKEYIKYGTFNYLYLISPSYESNTCLHTLEFEMIKGQDSRRAVADLMEILDDIKAKNNAYLFEQEYTKVYNKWRKGDRLEFDETMMLVRANYRVPEKISWPRPAIFIDDMINTELMANTINNELSNLSFHHRHIEGGVGVSIFQMVQTFKSGIPKGVRGNLSLLMLFPTCNMTEIEDIYKEVANNVTFDTFKKMFFEATKEKHGFLLIDRYAEPDRQFGINFNKKFIVDPIEERRKLLFGKTEQPGRKRKEAENEDVQEPVPDSTDAKRRRK